MALDLAVVPVAGLGTRMRPLTRAVPKELLPLGDRPVVERVVDELGEGGVRRAVLVTSAAKRAIEDHFDGLEDAGGRRVAVAAVRQPEMRGLGDAVARAEGFTGDGPFVVALGDCLVPAGVVAELRRRVLEDGCDGAIALERVAPEATSRYGIVRLGPSGATIRDIVEKPPPGEAPSDLAVCARYVLPAAVFDALRATEPGHGGEIQLTDAIAALIAGGARFAAVELPAGTRRTDVGTLEGYHRAVLDHLLGPRGGPGTRRRPTGDGGAPSRGRAYARAALAGNPSDGYGGAVLAVCVRDFGARATVQPAERMELVAPEEAVPPPATLGELTAQARTHGCDGAERLLRAACARFARIAGDRGRPADDLRVRLAVTTDVPRQVGLAGSSAIIIAALRALLDFHGVALDPEALARAALAAETEDLGTAAGLQDRICQSYEGLVAMDFATNRFEALDARRLPPLYLAWRQDAAGPSTAVHASLRERHASGERVVVDAMRRLGDLGREAADAARRGDHPALARCIDASFDARRSMLELDPRLVELVAAARDHGCSANYAGSGGAIAGTLPPGDPDGAFEALARRLRAEGAHVLRPSVHADAS